MVRLAGFAMSVAYAAIILWLYASQPQNRAEALGGLAATVGAYRVDDRSFDDGLSLFRKDKFPEARLAFERADPARRDSRTQFYVAYTFYRQGWGRLYSDDALFTQGLAAVTRAVDLAPGHRLVVQDESLGMHTGEELRSELERGLRREASDLNPMRVFAGRK